MKKFLKYILYKLIKLNFNSNKCPHCEFIRNLIDGDIKSNREYWIMTEIFVYLHNGDDHRDGNKTGKT